MRNDGPSRDLDDLFSRILPAFPVLSETEQQVGLRLYEQLLGGTPVRREELAAALDLATRDVVGLLDAGLKNLVLYDDKRRVTGYAGLSVLPTPHRLNVGAVELYTWCAWDSLFIPELIGRDCVVRSDCPVTRRPIQLSVASNQISAVEPEGVVMSFVIPEADFCDCSTSVGIDGFCNHVHFLATPRAGETWVTGHRRALVLSLDAAFRLAAMLNEARYPSLARSGTRLAPVSPGSG